MLDFSRYQFAPVIVLPADYEVYDFTAGYDPQRVRKSAYGIGRYDEKRKGMYTTPLFAGTQARDIHVGIDIAAPVGTAVHAFADGEIFLFGYNGAPGDYGYTLITVHSFDGVPLYALHGHLAARSIAGLRIGQRFSRDAVIAWVGAENENGGWNPHLHFQLCVDRPDVCDMPGVVCEADRAAALRKYPDPRLVLGPLY